MIEASKITPTVGLGCQHFSQAFRKPRGLFLSLARVDQTNNSYVFPGIGLAAIAVRARRISDAMLMAAARALAHLSPARHDPAANLLPPVTEARDVSARVAEAVAMQACKEGLTEPLGVAEIFRRIETKIWTPVYRPYQRQAG